MKKNNLKEGKNMVENLFKNRDFVEPKDLEQAGLMSKTMQWQERERGLLECFRVGSRKILYTPEHLQRYFERNQKASEVNEK